MNNVYYLLVHDHKHGNYYWLHSAYEHAQAHGVSLMRETAEEWGEDVSKYSDGDLWAGWSELTGETEFYSVQEITLED